MEKIIYSQDKATRAIRVFESLISEKGQAILNGSNKLLILLTTMAYYGKFKTEQIVKELGTFDNYTEDLLKLGILTVDKSSKPHIFTCHVEKIITDEYKNETVSDDIGYLFTSALFNIGAYIKEYGIKSWNVFGLVLEAALHMGYASDSINLPTDDIKSVSGQDFNKSSTRKKLVDLGFLKQQGSGRFTSFMLNKRAYLLGSGC